MNTFATFADFCRTVAEVSMPGKIAIDIIMQCVPELLGRIHLTFTGSRLLGKLLPDPSVWSDGSSLTWMIPGDFFFFLPFLFFSSFFAEGCALKQTGQGGDRLPGISWHWTCQEW